MSAMLNPLDTMATGTSLAAGATAVRKIRSASRGIHPAGPGLAASEHHEAFHRDALVH